MQIISPYPTALGKANCHAFDFRIKYRFLASFTRFSDLTHSSPSKPALPPASLPLQLFAFSSFEELSVALFQYSVCFLQGTCYHL